MYLSNATYVGFTGTPVDGTIEVFGGVVDAYTMTEAVKDGITVNLVYDGRAAKVMLNQDKVRQIEEYYAQCELEGANEHAFVLSHRDHSETAALCQGFLPYWIVYVFVF